MTPARRSEMEEILAVSLEVDPEPLLDDLDDSGFVIVDREQLRRVLRRSREQTHEARRGRDRAIARLADVISFDGASHDDPECPEDDTCSCANVRDINEILGREPRTAEAGARMSSARAEAWRLKEGQNLQDAERWRDHEAACKAAGREPTLEKTDGEPR